MLIALEGIDGSGKSTLARMLVERLNEQGYPAVYLFEPTDQSQWGKEIRRRAESHDRPGAEEELELFIKDRIYDVENNIKPNIERGNIVVMDRYYLSSAAYQGARGLDVDEIIARHRNIAPEPDIAVVIDIEPSIALQRMGGRGGERDGFEVRDYLERVRDNYLKIAKRYDYVVLVDGSGSIDDVFSHLWQIVSEYIDGGGVGKGHNTPVSQRSGAALVFEIQDFLEHTIPTIDNTMRNLRKSWGGGLEWRVVREEGRLIVFIRPETMGLQPSPDGGYLERFVDDILGEVNSALKALNTPTCLKYILGSTLETVHASPYERYRIEYMARRISGIGGRYRKLLAALIQEGRTTLKSLETKYAMDNDIVEAIHKGGIEDLKAWGYIVEDLDGVIYPSSTAISEVKDKESFGDGEHRTLAPPSHGGEKYLVFIDGRVVAFDAMVILETLISSGVPYKIAVPVTRSVVQEIEGERFVPARTLSYSITERLKALDPSGRYAKKHMYFTSAHEFLYYRDRNGVVRPLTRKRVKALARSMVESADVVAPNSMYNDLSAHVFDACRILGMGIVREGNIHTIEEWQDERFIIPLETLESMILAGLCGVMPYFDMARTGGDIRAHAKALLTEAIHPLEITEKRLSMWRSATGEEVRELSRYFTETVEHMGRVLEAVLLMGGIMPLNSLKSNASTVIGHRYIISRTLSNKIKVSTLYQFVRGLSSLYDMMASGRVEVKGGMVDKALATVKNCLKVVRGLIGDQ